MKYVSRKTAVENLGRIFQSAGGADYRTIEDVCRDWGREGFSERENLLWFRNILTYLKHYELALPVYQVYGKSKRLVGLRLNPDLELSVVKSEYARPVTLESLAVLIRDFELQNPSLRVEWSAVPRRDGPRSS